MDHDEEQLSRTFDQSVARFGSLRANIGQLKVGDSRNFRGVLDSYRNVPDMSSEEGRKFRNMMELIEDACNSFDKIAEAQRKYVLCTKDFAKENIDFISDAQRGELEAEDIRELVRDWRDSIDKMTEYNNRIAAVSDQFNGVLRDLRRAQGDAASGKERGRKGERNSDIGTGLFATGAAGSASAAAATVATSGLAAPAIALAAAAFTFGAGALKFASDSETHKKWKETFALVSRQLDDAYGYITTRTVESKNVLTDLSTYSQQLADKSAKMANRRKILSIQRWQARFDRLEDESNKMKTACIDYIRKDNAVRGITGTMGMARLSLE